MFKEHVGINNKFTLPMHESEKNPRETLEIVNLSLPTRSVNTYMYLNWVQLHGVKTIDKYDYEV